MLYDQVNSRLLLGALLLNPQILNNDKYKINKLDFKPVEFHYRLFQAIQSLAKHGAKSIDAIDVYNLAERHQSIRELFDNNQLKDFVDTVKQLANIDNLDLYYNEVKKNSALRKYQESGFDISRFEYDVANVTLQEIVDYYEGLQIGIKKEFFADKNIVEARIGDQFESIKEQFKAEPMYGASTFSGYLNTAARGWINGQLSVYSIGSGMGKSTLGLANLVRVCCPEMYSFQTHQFEPNPCCQHKAGLYIQFEMDIQSEITPKIVATISGVPTFHILNGKYEDDEEARVDKAIQVLHRSNLYAVTMPSFTTGMIETYVRDYVLNKGVGYVVYDYIVEGPSASSDIASQNKVQTRSDQVLSALASKLKDLAVEYNIAVMSFTQVNANASSQEILDAGVVAGSRAVQNKCDVAGVIMPLRKQEQEICDMMMETNFPNVKVKPNRILHLYKMRFSNYEQGIKIWFHLDLNTGLTTDYFVTTKHDQPYPMPKTNLVYTK